MEKRRADAHSEFAQKWKIKELQKALVLAIGSIGLVAGALSISLVGQLEESEVERVRIKGWLENGSLTIDPELQSNESLLVTVPEIVEMMGQSVRLADGRREPPYMEKIYSPTSVWSDIDYLLTVDGGDETTEYQCEVDPETVVIEGTEVSYVLVCE